MRLTHFEFTFIFCFIFSFSQHNIKLVRGCLKYVRKSLSVPQIYKCADQSSIVKALVQPILMSAEVSNLSFDFLSLNVRGIRSNDQRMTILKVTPTTFWLKCTNYPNALNFAPHVNWKLMIKSLVF